MVLKKEIDTLLKNVNEFYYKDGVFATIDGFSIAFNREMIGIRIDLDYVTGRNSYPDNILIIDLNKRGRIKRSVIATHSTNKMRVIYNEDIIKYLKLFNETFNVLRENNDRLIDIKKMFNQIERERRKDI